MDIDKLVQLNSQYNNGNGISCINSFINCIKHNNIDMAKRVYQGEGDKIISYPLLQQWFYENIGCRSHFKINCDNRLCSSLKKYHDDDLNKLQ